MKPITFTNVAKESKLLEKLTMIAAGVSFLSAVYLWLANIG
jgi:hypothetical protein